MRSGSSRRGRPLLIWAPGAQRYGSRVEGRRRDEVLEVQQEFLAQLFQLVDRLGVPTGTECLQQPVYVINLAADAAEPLRQLAVSTGKLRAVKPERGHRKRARQRGAYHAGSFERDV